MSGIWHGVRYGVPAAQKYLGPQFNYPYDILFVNAKTLVQFGNSVAGLVSENIGRVKYVIDPQIYSFQNALEYLEGKNGTITKGFQKLIGKFGEPINDAIFGENRPVRPSDFKGKVIDKFVQRVIDFQEKEIQDQINGSGNAKIFTFLKKQGILPKGNVEPEYLIAPYFFISSVDDPWLNINIELIKSTKLKAGKKAAAQIVLAKNVLLVPNAIDQIIDKYSKKEILCDTTFLWVDDFDEGRADIDQIKGYKRLIKKLGQNSKVGALYGGYFSIDLIKNTTKGGGVVHGLEYGESRPVYPVGGGVPTSKYYIPSFHKRYIVDDAVKLLRNLRWLVSPAAFKNNVCNCKVCQKTIRGNAENDFGKFGLSAPAKSGSGRLVPTAEAKELCLTHYLNTKTQEFKQSFDPVKFKESLKEDAQLLSTASSSGGKDGNHLLRWLTT